jgi:hypothetical protein
VSDSSTTPLLFPYSDQAPPSKAHSEVLRKPFGSSMTIPNDADIKDVSTSISARPALEPRKSKSVHYMDSRVHPAPPTEVLARTGSAVQESSAGAAEATTTQDEIAWGDVVMRG